MLIYSSSRRYKSGKTNKWNRTKKKEIRNTNKKTKNKNKILQVPNQQQYLTLKTLKTLTLLRIPDHKKEKNLSITNPILC